MDASELVVLQWLAGQREPLTLTEIHNHFLTMPGYTVSKVLQALAARNLIEQGKPRGFMETWQIRKGGQS